MSGEGFGGIADLSQTDIAASLSGLRGQTYQLMRLKFCGDESVRRDLQHSITMQILVDGIRDDTDVSAKVAVALARLIIDEAMRSQVCRSCGGTGTILSDSEAKDCPSCSGSGRRSLSQRAAARAAGVSAPTYGKRYASTVDRFLSHLQTLESIGLRHASRRLYGNNPISVLKN